MKSFYVTKHFPYSFFTIGKVGCLCTKRQVICCAIVYINNLLFISECECYVLLTK
jgi:hypothetical protein